MAGEQTESYFSKNSEHVDLARPGALRRGQAAAIHSLVGHLLLKFEPAIAVLPTGAGKTDVAILLPYVLRANRVLFVVPSDAVRNQVAEKVVSLAVLKKTGVLDSGVPLPRVKKLSKRVASLEEWEKLREFDVVVTIPSSISPLLQGVLKPPEDLFDLLIIDEAHHSPARTWQSVLDSFPHSKRALFTATPFRRDKKQIKGKMVVNYLLREARKDEVFGEIMYRPITPVPGEDPDVAIAKAAESALKADRDEGFEHSILIRADNIPRANVLMQKYRDNTALSLELVHSHFSSKRIHETIDALKNRTLDGVVCVNMLGEGFDFPNLKIAALHAPHASLGVTLQFVGRFARTKDQTVGTAQFFAVPAEIEGEMEFLFREENGWQDLIANLSESRILEEDRLRTDLATFEAPLLQEPEMEGLSLYALRPGYHAKLYRVPPDLNFDISSEITLPRPFEVVHRQVSESLCTAIIVAREQQRPRWSHQQRFGRVEYELFVIHFDEQARFLFISASRRADSLYRHIASEYVGFSLKGLPLYMVNRALAGLRNVECFSVGMKNRLHMTMQESYRVIAGRHAQQCIKKTDGRLFHQGHIYCTALNDAGARVTLGYSSGSKIWSAGTGSVPSLVQWCEELSRKMESDAGVIRAPGLDILEVGVPLTELPDDVFAVDWDPIVYEGGVGAVLGNDDSDTPLLADFSIKVDRNASSKEQIRVVLEYEDEAWGFDFSPETAEFFTQINGRQIDVWMDDDTLPLVAFLNEYPLYFYCTNFAKFSGQEYFPCAVGTDLFDRDNIQTIDWTTENVNIVKEFWKSADERNGMRSVHEFLEQYLNCDNNQVVLYDHRSGEVADFLSIAADEHKVQISLYHCKGSGGEAPGDRPDDLYEVCGQVVKSFQLLRDEKKLIKHARRRVNQTKVKSRFVRGSLAEMENALRNAGGKQMQYQFVVVQPGVSKSALGEKGLSILAAADDFIHSLGAQKLLVLGSA